MRIKLDGNLPGALRDLLGARGHDVDTVADEGLSGADDGVVQAAAERDRRVLLTLDKGISTVPARANRGLVLVCALQRGAGAVARLVEAALPVLETLPLAGRTTVVTPAGIRQRRS